MAQNIFSKKEVKKLLASYKQKLVSRHIPVDRMYLYGSYAQGKPHQDSDIDVCIISPSFNDRIEATMMLMKIRNDQELFISPIAFSPQSFVAEDPLAWEIHKKGIQIA